MYLIILGLTSPVSEEPSLARTDVDERFLMALGKAFNGMCI